jgi:hypothetical protein
MKLPQTPAQRSAIAPCSKTFFPAPSEHSDTPFFSPPVIQTKLNVSQPGDRYEQEADNVAEQVVQKIETSSVQKKCDKCEGLPVQEKCEHCQEEEKLQQKEKDGGGIHDAALESQIRSSQGSGQSLPGTTQQEMGSSFGADFSNVNIHDNASSHEMSSTLSAKAFTVGSDIYFNKGEYNPGSRAGKSLLAHELTHTIQQGKVNTVSMKIDRQEDAGVDGPRDAGLPGGVPSAPTEPEPMGPPPPTEAPRDRTSKVPTVSCPTTFTAATSFTTLIDLVRAAEIKLSAAGITSTQEQIHSLRGIYYGTIWSHDYSVEHSAIRNEGFQRFTRPSAADPVATAPRDIQTILDCGLFTALFNSQDVTDGTRHVDFGHLIIGMDARYDPALTTNVQYPVAGGIMNIDMGGSGTELVTWLGDLGGAAAGLSIRRVGTPTTSASTVFTGTDYGGSINLEGDIAGFVVGAGSSTALTAPVITAGSGSLSDALTSYLMPGSSTYDSRATTFLSMYGGTFDPTTRALTNGPTLITIFANKIQTFACNYLASRVRDTRITYAQATSAATHIIPASTEVATTFVNALADNITGGGKIEATRFPSPSPAGTAACATQIAAGRLAGGLGL